jgi:hypothetical protein
LISENKINPETSLGLEKLIELTKNLGYSMDDLDGSLRTVLNNLTIFGNIDMLGYTSKSLTDMEKLVGNIQDLMNQLSSTGQITSE